MFYAEPTEAEQIAYAADQVHTGLQRLLALATRTADPAPHLAVLRALWAPYGSGRRSSVQELADVLDTLSASLAETTDERAGRAADLLKVAHDVLEDTIGGDHVERAQQLLADLAAAGTAQAGPWEAVLDSATFTPHLIARCADEMAARDAAEAWLREHRTDVTGLAWTPDPQMAAGEYDRWLTLTQTDSVTGMACATDIVVRCRAGQAGTGGDHDFGDLVTGPGDLA